MRSNLIPIALLAGCLLAAGPVFAAETIGAAAGLEASYTAIPDAPETGIAGYASSDMSFGPRWGLQADGWLGGLANGDTAQGQAALALHGYIRARPELAIGLYGGLGASEPTATLGIEAASTPEVGWGFDAYYDESFGGGDLDGGFITGKGFDVTRSWGDGYRGGIFGRKDTTNRSGATDRDYYQYGLLLEVPVSRDRGTRLTLDLGQVRLDAAGEAHAAASIGLLRIPPDRKRPTFGRRRHLLDGLLAR